MIRYIPDPFEELPSEVRLPIFLSLECKSSILPLIEASPAMLQSYLADKMRILRALLADELNEEMIQDAMAIILCPKDRGFGLHRLRGRAATTMVRFIRRWSEYRLPNPTVEEDKDGLLIRLNNLHNRLIVLIEDYITKGTASSPPREYSCVPQMRTNERHLVFKDAKIARRFDSTNLSAAERQRFLHAFLVHELCCMTGNIEFHQQAMHMSTDSMIYNRILSRIQYESLECVDLYFRSLYGAIFAQCADDGFLPRVHEGCPLHLRIRSPIASVFDAEHYKPKLPWHESRTVSVGEYAKCFSRIGLDRIFEFLSYDLTNLDGRKALQAQMKFVWDFQHPGRTKEWSKAYKSLMLTVGEDPFNNIYKSLGIYNPNHDRLTAARQSAWIFFDDERLYPPEPTYQWVDRRKQPRRQPGRKYDRREITLGWKSSVWE